MVRRLSPCRASHRQSEVGETIYTVMLVMALVALALAITFPLIEYLSSYSGVAGAQKVAPPVSQSDLATPADQPAAEAAPAAAPAPASG